VRELLSFNQPGGGCPNGSQVGVSTILGYELSQEFHEPLYMMRPPGGDVVARLGTVAGIYPTFIDIRVRSESDYGLVAEVRDATAAARLERLETTLWGVPAAPSHDTERCTVAEAFKGCLVSPPRPPGSLPLPFLTNPTRCGVPLAVGVDASSWQEAGLDAAKEAQAPLGQISGCDALPFGPSLEVEPSSHAAAAPSGAEVTIRLPASEGTEVLEPSQIRSLSVRLPAGMAINPSSGQGLGVCSEAQVRYGERVAAQCPDDSKLASTEFDVPVLERNLKGAVYLREPQPGRPYRIWIVADDLGLHLKLRGEMEVDKQSGQITTVTTEIPQAPLREAKIDFKSGFRAPLVTPEHCGTFYTRYEFTPWSGGPPVAGTTPMTISEGCDTGGFEPKLAAGSTDAAAGAFSPFLFTLTRRDGEQNPAALSISLPKGLTASFAGIPRCEGAAAASGACPAASEIGRVAAAIGAGPTPLWVPEAGKRPTAVYLGGPYRGAPTSIIAVVPKQAGPFDFGDEVVRSAVHVDPRTARASAVTDPLPQLIEGIPIGYRTIHVVLDRPRFTLNPTSCRPTETAATVTSAQGAVATPTARYAALGCSGLAFKPSLSLRLKGGTHRSAHPALTATLKMPSGGANVASASVALPHSEFLDQSSLNRVCTRPQFAAKACPAGSVYGTAVARTPLFDFPLEGNVYLGTGYGHKLPDLVAELKGPASFPVEIDLDGRIDELKGGIRTSFEAVPDAPVSSFVLKMRGGRHGLLVNSTSLCRKTRRATARFTGQNGRVRRLRPALKVRCPRHRRHRGHRRKGR
jgi:hypothetical protein